METGLRVRAHAIRGVVLAVSFSLGACGAPEQEAPVTEVTVPPVADTALDPSARDLVVIPPSQGSYDEMWSGLRDLEVIVKPLSTESAKQMLQTLKEGDGSAPADAVSPQPFIVSSRGRDGQALWIVLYTDSRILKPDTYSIQEPVAEALTSALHSDLLTGVAFNTFTEIARHRPFEYRVDKLYLAGLIGYLTASDPEPGGHWSAANDARQAGKPYEALHHAMRALEEKEEWAQCEPAKLWAMWELDFPGSRDMALEELEWFIGEGNDTEETRSLLERFRAESEQSSGAGSPE